MAKSQACSGRRLRPAGPSGESPTLMPMTEQYRRGRAAAPSVLPPPHPAGPVLLRPTAR